MKIRVLINRTKSAFHVYGNNGRSFVLNPHSGAQARNSIVAIIHAETSVNRRIDEAVRLKQLTIGTLRDLSACKAANVGLMFDASCKPASTDGPLTSAYCTLDFLRREFPDIAEALNEQHVATQEAAKTEAAAEPEINPLAIAAGTVPAPVAPINREFAFRRDLPDDRLGVLHDGSNVTIYVNRSGAFIITPISKISAGDLFRISRRDGSFVTHNDIAVYKALTDATTDGQGNTSFECKVSITSQPGTESPRADVVTAPQITAVPPPAAAQPAAARKGKGQVSSTRSSSLPAR